MIKKTIGLSLIGLIAVADYIINQSILLTNNETLLVATIAAVLLCFGLEGGPSLVALGLNDFCDKTRLASGTGKMKSVVFLIVGGACTLVSFAGIFYIRWDVIIESGGFSGGNYANLIMLIVTISTSFIAFGITLWMASYGIADKERKVKHSQKEYDKALAEVRQAEIDFKNALSKAWSKHFTHESMPRNHMDAIDAMRKKTSNELVDRLESLLPKIINVNSLVTPFTSIFKTELRPYVDDPRYLALVSIDHFEDDKKIEIERKKLEEECSKVINEIIETISNGRKVVRLNVQSA